MRKTLAGPVALIALVFAGACSESSTEPVNLNCTGGAPLAVDATVNGTLQQGDDLDIDGAYLDRYSLTVEEAGTIRITMRSDDVDSWLWLLNTNGTVITADDDSGGGLDAQITRSLNRGCYLVEATSAFPGETGAYVLSTQRL
jgi:hypothetical protein